MVFINPKTIVSVEDVNIIINDLCSGFAFSSICSFGFWGTTKELFRQIGMMDERFIGGEWEDNDFGLRIKQLDAAVNWRFDWSKYPFSHLTYKPSIKHISQSTYSMKWHIIDGVYHRTDQILEEKLLPLEIRNNYRENIRNSWNKWNKSVGDRSSTVFNEVDAAIFSNKIAKSNMVKSSARLIFEQNDSNKIKITFLCNIPTSVNIVIVNAKPIGKEGTTYYANKQIGSNQYYSFSFFPHEYDIRVFHQGKTILNNMSYRFPKHLEYELGLNICQFQT